MPTSSCPSGRLEPPMTTMGQRKEMRRAACTPRASKATSHTAERCRCRPSGPGPTLCVQAGSGCRGAGVTRTRGGGQGGRCPSPRKTAWGRPPPAGHAPHLSWPCCGPLQCVQSAARPHCAHCRPRSGRVHDRCVAGRLALLFGRLHTRRGRESAPGVLATVWRPRVERDLQTGRSVQGTNGERGSKDGAMQQ